MAVPKKRTSILKKRIRKNIWKKEGGWTALKTSSVVKSLSTGSTGNSKNFFVKQINKKPLE
uniref:Large ribosomal subunit protein bL32c n=1 Tax=Eriostemon banksii TaxID=2981376 RepID=A0AA49I2Z9_9ROSI|nr:ribosomal protein L32 [Eriostemon banksii]WAJ50579.1 ribosomal protein L32 [Eriostemon banksii]